MSTMSRIAKIGGVTSAVLVSTTSNEVMSLRIVSTAVHRPPSTPAVRQQDCKSGSAKALVSDSEEPAAPADGASSKSSVSWLKLLGAGAATAVGTVGLAAGGFALADDQGWLDAYKPTEIQKDLDAAEAENANLEVKNNNLEAEKNLVEQSLEKMTAERDLLESNLTSTQKKLEYLEKMGELVDVGPVDEIMNNILTDLTDGELNKEQAEEFVKNLDAKMENVKTFSEFQEALEDAVKETSLLKETDVEQMFDDLDKQLQKINISVEDQDIVKQLFADHTGGELKLEGDNLSELLAANNINLDAKHLEEDLDIDVEEMNKTLQGYGVTVPIDNGITIVKDGVDAMNDVLNQAKEVDNSTVQAGLDKLNEVEGEAIATVNNAAQDVQNNATVQAITKGWGF